MHEIPVTHSFTQMITTVEELWPSAGCTTGIKHLPLFPHMAQQCKVPDPPGCHLFGIWVMQCVHLIPLIDNKG